MSYLWNTIDLKHYSFASLAPQSSEMKIQQFPNQFHFERFDWMSFVFTLHDFGPTTCVIATVKLIVRHFVPSSLSTQSLYTMFVVLRLLWNSAKNFDFVNNSVKALSTFIGRIVFTNSRPSCIDVHSAVDTNGTLFSSSESVVLEASVIVKIQKQIILIINEIKFVACDLWSLFYLLECNRDHL